MPADEARFLLSPFRSKTARMAAGLVILAVALSGLTIWGVGRRSAPPRSIGALQVPAAGHRLLVISPHPDDESLGAGGLIARALANGASVREVFVTNGDGYRYGAERFDRRLRLSPAQYISYGQQRQQEALEAARRLGVGPENIVFMGFPDHGVAVIWKNYWNPHTAYTSLTTGRSSVPYALALRPGAPYNAPALLDGLQQVMEDYRPTEIYVTATYDSHPDHWAAGAFAMAAASRVEAEDTDFKPAIYTFVIHSGLWQVLPVLEPDKTLLPPGYFLSLGDSWYELPLTPYALALKKKAIAAYRTQEMVMHTFLNNFERPNELLSLLNTRTVAVIAPEALSGGRVTKWPDAARFATNPAGDAMKRNKSQSSDLKSASIVRSGNSLFLQLNTVAAERFVTYEVSIYILPRNITAPVRRYGWRINPGKKRTSWLNAPDGYDTKAAGIWNQDGRIEVSLPGALSPDDQYLMFTTDTYIGGLLLGRVPWSVMQL